MSSDAPLRRGDLNATLRENALFLPAYVVVKLNEMGIRNTTDFLSLIFGFPTALAHALDWDDKDVQAAQLEIRRVLDGHVDAILLAPNEHPEPSYGAINPRPRG